jgi:ornithine cyclodeaminase/alanine dehydrogenase-like protein (mu-crystallin family)
MSREDSEVICMLGAGGMARSHMEAFMCVRDIKKLQVYSPTKANRDAYADEMCAKWDIEVISCDNAEDAYKGADIVAGCTNASVPVIRADLLQPGMHILNVGGGTGMVSPEAQDKVDVYFRFGNAPAPEGIPEMALADEWVTYAARADVDNGLRQKPLGTRAHGVAMPDKVIYFSDIMESNDRGRTSSDQITYSERGNLQGNQFHAVAGRTFELAKEAGLGNEIPTEWLLQDIRD